MEALSISAEYPAEASPSARQHSVPQISISAKPPGETSMSMPTTPQYTTYMPQHTQNHLPAAPLYEKVENSHPHPASASNAIELRNSGQSIGHTTGQPIQMPYPSQSHNSLHTAFHNVYIDEGPVEMPRQSQYTAPPLAPYPTTPPPPSSHVSSEPTILHRSGRQHPTQLLPEEIGTRTMSQSRKRKAKMEAALGVRY
ncbi:hypothetical protein B0O99DRAFT_598141 [Bisporella sp. PMI_857]|nr:hypothetical protein B0O99DRAFT_598141 [Bisporella sp. PMI_857]